MLHWSSQDCQLVQEHQDETITMLHQLCVNKCVRHIPGTAGWLLLNLSYSVLDF
jgi:hypothetical protein